MDRFNIRKAKTPIIKQEKKQVKPKINKGTSRIGGSRVEFISKCPHCGGNPTENECTVNNMQVTYCGERLLTGKRCMEVIKWNK